MNTIRSNINTMTAEELEAEMRVRFYNAVDAAAHLRLPVYLLSEPASRRRHEIPHYQFNRFVRYRLDELEAWMRRHSEKEAARAA
jgi:hypothetical protein